MAGLAAAVLLARAGRQVEVWEASDEIGGLLAPIPFRGQPYDRGSHRVHPEAHPLLQALTKDQGWARRPRRGRLVLGGRQLAYPPDPVAFLRGLGLRAATEMALGFVSRPGTLNAFRTWERDRSTASDEDEGFESFVVRRVGRGAYRRFYAPYVEKVWGLHPSEVSRTVAKQRVSTSDPTRAFRRAFRRTGAVDRWFMYPRMGMAALITHLASVAADLGVKVRLGRPFRDPADGRGFDAVLFSGHLSHLEPDASLSHRGLYLLHLAFPAGTLGPQDTWYAPEPRYWFGRVSQPAQFSSDLEADGEDVVCVEIPEGRWGPHQDFTRDLDEVVGQLAHAGILRGRASVRAARQTFLPRVYPLYRRGWFPRWRSALESVASRGPILPIGRQGLFLHCNIDHAVHIADEAVRHLVAGGDAVGWVRRCSAFLDLRVRD